MGALPPHAVPRRAPAAQLLDLPGGRLLVRHGSGLSLLGGVARSEVEALLERVDGVRTVASVAEGAPDPKRALELLAALAGEAIHLSSAATPAGPARGDAPRLTVLVSGAGGAALAGRVEATVAAEVRVVEVAPGEGGGGDGREPAPEMAGADLVVVALEEVPYARLLEVQRACLDRPAATLFVAQDPDGVRVGPAVLPGAATPCLGCSLLAALSPARLPAEAALAAAARLVTGRLDLARLPLVAQVVAREVAALVGGTAPSPPPRCLGELLLVEAGGRVRPLPVAERGDCPACRARPATPPAGVRAAAAAGRADRHLALRSERAPLRVRSTAGGGAGLRVGILGGGTAGGLAALAFRARRPGDRVILIRSSEVPVIGVGEATTPLMPQFLHADLGVGAAELFREVRPTFKLGIRFEWGAPAGAGGGFPYPFGPVRTLDAMTRDGHLRAVSLQAALMAGGALPVEEGPDGRLQAAFGTEVAYHLDNRRFAGFLERLAADRGVETVDARITGVERRPGPDGEEEVAALVADDGRRFELDLYVDCSGFRSLLLGDALRSPFESYEGSLFTDRALVGEAPHAGGLAPETVARTMAAGWCWSIPQEETDHVGYVFSERFLDPDRAAAELRRFRPGIRQDGLREVRFRAGRRRHFWRGNVVALGNAYGFVEPLESTSLHLLIRQIGMLLRALPDDAREVAGRAGALRPLLDRRVGAFWDYVRWFLALHFRFNRRLDSPFWRACRDGADVSAHGELLELFRERGPLAYDPAARSLFDFPDPLWGPEGVDLLLLGQGVPCRLPEPSVSLEVWRRQRARCQRVVARSLSQAELLRRLPEHPQVLAALEAGFRARGPAFPAG